MDDNEAFGNNPAVFEAGPDALGMRLDQWLARHLAGLSRSRLKRLIEQGSVRRNFEVLDTPSAKIRPGDRIAVEIPPPEAGNPKPENIPLTVVFEDEHLIVIDKPAGLVTHPGAGNWSGTLVNALLHHCGSSLSGIGGVVRPGIVHRLDKETSGLIVAAKTDAAHAGLRRQFDRHTIDRAYRAFVWGCPRPLTGTVDAALARHPHNRLKRAVAKPADSRAKTAVTHYRVIRKYGGDPAKTMASLVECRLQTGRTHQIRVHMAHIGNPVLGDPLYAPGRKLLAIGEQMEHNENIEKSRKHFRRQALHAFRLGFEHPQTHEQIVFESVFPEDLKMLELFLERF